MKTQDAIMTLDRFACVLQIKNENMKHLTIILALMVLRRVGRAYPAD
jgi:hypothetical protein